MNASYPARNHNSVLFAPVRPAGRAIVTSTAIMIVRCRRLPLSPSGLPSLFNPSNPTSQCIRALHQHISASRIPPPTPFVPDAPTFLTLIGRNLSKHAAKIPSWEALFSLTSQQLRELGVEPARSRRYLLRWREKFRNGDFGVGGDLKSVKDKVGEVRVLTVPKTTKHEGVDQLADEGLLAGRRIVASVPQESSAPSSPIDGATPIKRLKVRGTHTIAGPHVELVKGSGGRLGRIPIKDGLWEQRRGHKVDGGERRKAEVRAKRRGEERRTTRK